MRISKCRDFIDDAISSDVEDCIIWPFAVRKSSGYGAYTFRVDGAKKNSDVHRYVCSLVHGEGHEGMQAAHSCGKPLCINPRHLKWATPLENMADAMAHGTLRGGGRYRQRIFSVQMVDIKTSRESLLSLAERYDMAPSYIGRLRRNAKVAG